MNILHLLSQNHLTGAEVYAVQLAQQQVLQHNVFQISDDFFAETAATKIRLPVESKSKIQFIKNIFWLRRFLIQNKIHVIHHHSRAAAKLAYWARVGLKVASVATVHGRQQPSLSKKIFNQYGDFIVCVCEAIKDQLIKDLKLKKQRLWTIRNAVCEKDFHFLNNSTAYHKDKMIRIAVIGRTTGPKGERTRQILNALPTFQKELGFQAKITLVGASNAAITLNLDPDVIVDQVHVSKLTSADYNQYDLVIGSGRVAVESILTGVPTICFGEASYQGLARENNIEQFMKSNFGDIEVHSKFPRIDLPKLKSDLEDFFSTDFSLSERQRLAMTVKEQFDAKRIASLIFRLYESAYFLRNYPKWIPTLMYHKIPNEPIDSVHKIFVTKNDFRKHLEFFKNKGFSTLTYTDLKKYACGELDFKTFPKKPLILTFDDGYVDNLENASPLLKEFGFKAQIFLLADEKIASNIWDHSPTENPHEIVSGADRLKWKTSAFEIGSHGFHHQKITTMTDAQAFTELKESKISLEKEFGIEVPVFAFTYGDTSRKAALLAFNAGYDYALNTDTGGLLLEESPYQGFRINIFPNETTRSLSKKTSTWYRRYYYWKRKQ